MNRQCPTSLHPTEIGIWSLVLRSVLAECEVHPKIQPYQKNQHACGIVSVSHLLRLNRTPTRLLSVACLPRSVGHLSKSDIFTWMTHLKIFQKCSSWRCCESSCRFEMIRTNKKELLKNGNFTLGVSTPWYTATEEKSFLRYPDGWHEKNDRSQEGLLVRLESASSLKCVMKRSTPNVAALPNLMRHSVSGHNIKNHWRLNITTQLGAFPASWRGWRPVPTTEIHGCIPCYFVDTIDTGQIFYGVLRAHLLDI